MIYKNKYDECTHFDGKECRNQESRNYGSYGEFCIDCKNINKGDDIMNNIEKLAEEVYELIDANFEPFIDFDDGFQDAYYSYMESNEYDEETTQKVWDYINDVILPREE